MCQKKVKMKKLVKSSNKDEVNKMTPSDQQQLKAHLKAAAKILYRNTWRGNNQPESHTL
jgi:hypothetical protein